MLCSEQLNKCNSLYHKGNQIRCKKEEKFYSAQLSILLKQRVKNQEISQEFDGTAKQKIIREFRKECESNRKKHAVLVVRAESDSETWTIAGFSKAGYFKEQWVSGPGDELCEELKKKHVKCSFVISVLPTTEDGINLMKHKRIAH